jgi:hypothetical protein
MRVAVVYCKVPSRNFSGRTEEDHGKFVSEVILYSWPSRACSRNDINYTAVFDFIDQGTELSSSLLARGSG